jgi:hypothetical protein
MNDSLIQQEKMLEMAVNKSLSRQPVPLSLENLFHKILSRIAAEAELKKLKAKLWVISAALAVTLGVLVLALAASFAAFSKTPSFQFLRLIFTDFKVVADNWQDYGFSILETLPLGVLAFLLSSILASFIVFDFAARQLGNFRKLLNAQHHGKF